MKPGLLFCLMVLAVATTAHGQVTAPRPTLDRELEDRARQILRSTLDTATPPVVGTNQAPEVPEPILVPFLFGVVILKDRDQLKVEGVPRSRPLQVPPDDPLLNTEEFEDLVLRYCQKTNLTESVMRRLQRDIILFYRKHGRPLVSVLYEDQDVSNGMLQITVIEGKLSEVKIQDTQGHPYTNGPSNPDLLRRFMTNRVGKPILSRQLNADIDWLNRNPFRKVQPYFEPGQGYSASDLVLRVEDRLPFEVFGGYDNTGSPETGENRIFAGLNWGKAFGRQDNLFTYQFIANPDLQSLRAHVASYSMPLPWRHVLRVFGSYVDVKGDIETGDLEGNSWQTSLRYDVPLPVMGRMRHELSAGLDFKKSDNSLIFGVAAPINTPTEIFQFVFGYTAGLADAWGQTAFAAQLVYSPGDVTSLNTDEAFQEARQFADANYFYGRLTAERETRLWRALNPGPDRPEMPGDYLRWRLRGMFQLSDGNLLPSEQLGWGGYATVRGYSEREVNVDEGWMISNELWSPAFHPAKLVGLHKVEDRLEFLFFWDYAVGHNKDLITTPGSAEDKHIILSSVGPGVRYSIGRYLTARFDYGFPLSQTGVDPTQHDDPRAHVSVTLSY